MFAGGGKKGGFSIIELAIALTVIALVLASALQTYQIYIQTKVVNDTSAHSQAVMNALARHIFSFQTLPCPAPPGLPPGAPGAGQAAGGGTAAACAAFVAAHTAHPYCDPSPGSITYGLCLVDGKRHSPANPNPITQMDPVLIGTIPYYDLGVTVKESLDGSGNRLTYAVSYYATQGMYSNTNGAINVEASNNGLIAPSLYSGKANAFPFVYFSAGPDGMGAYDYYGKQPVPCGGIALDVENCNGDATFLRSGNTTADNIYSVAAGAAHYDDTAFVDDVALDVDKWIMNSVGTMSNKSLGRVGIGNNTPAYSLDVGGNIKAQSVMVDTACDAGGTNCFNQSLLGNGVDCNGSLITGIANSQVECSTPGGIKLKGKKDCGTQYVVGVDANGALVCAP